MLELAKPALDVGLFTNAREPMLAFWQDEVGVPFTEMLPLGGGLQQHRHAIGNSVLKLNHVRHALAEAAPGGIRGLTLAREGLREVRHLIDPDGNRLSLVPRGHQQVTQLRVHLTVSALVSHQRFYGEILGLPSLDPVTFLCGDSQIRLEQGDATPDPAQTARGYRYLTVQVFDVVGVHARVLARGGQEGRPPMRLGDVAFISFVRDPDGNWLEISQRKSLTGSLEAPE